MDLQSFGDGARRVIPSCAVWKVREAFPSEDGVYVPFIESEVDVEKKCPFFSSSKKIEKDT